MVSSKSGCKNKSPGKQGDGQMMKMMDFKRFLNQGALLRIALKKIPM